MSTCKTYPGGTSFLSGTRLYIRELARSFWNIADVQYYKAEGLDIQGVDVSETLQQTMNEIT
ncbi:MAG: hypothetical protein PHX95_00510 [Lachnospiraceae bacterium]|jgi:hypothetical protein|nr:hypothetical protein [Lachnospiraceae bacterium]